MAIAHRGGTEFAVENTLDAFATARDLGVRYVETDVRVTADGAAVLLHDRTLRRIARCPGSIARLRRRELPGWVPTLEEALDRLPDACFAIDIKDPAAVGPVVRALTTRSAAERVCVAGTWDRTLATLSAALGPSLSVALGWNSLARLVSAAGGASPLTGGPAGFVHIPLRLGGVRIFSDALLRRAHAAGIRVIVWTVNDAATMERLLDAGVDGIITDRPSRLREVLIRRGEWTAGATQLA
ncbi:MAG: glycerophosphodiester phosphodiesterase [Actinobacteria bacterium]|nr:glycerophosphodiester phosphodiesterase [Actinomycetota bacterium]